ncbi:MAG: hypothetical protein IJY82_07410 [Oscillospiraceae bacterium]|nr:hypothetical protein [Oscillospiraceae bacterium]
MAQQWIQWSGGPLRADGTRSICDWQAAADVKVNHLSIYYLAYKENGDTVYGVPTPAQYQRVMEHAAYDVENCKRLGINLIGYVDTVQYAEETAAEMGLTLDDINAITPKGDYASTKEWHPAGLYVACINAPKWRAWLTENLRLTAAAGFGGLQYDFHPYAGASLFCQCKYCREGWAKRSRELFGREMEIPAAPLDFSTEEGRAYWWWKIDTYGEFMEETVSEAKKINPDFILLMNNNAAGTNFAFEMLDKGGDMPTSEHVGSNNGYSSTLFLYQMAEALGFHDLYTQYGTASEIDPLFRYKVNICESFAVNGGISYVADQEGVGRKAFLFGDDHANAFEHSKSLAEVAVLWSVESNLFSMKPEEFDYATLLYSFKTDRARQAASALVKSGVTYDYVALEKEDILERLDQYRVLILPEYTYFNDKTWKPVLEEIISSGKELIVLGKAGQKYVGATSDSIRYVPGFTLAESEQEQTVSDSFRKALEEAGAWKQVSIGNNVEKTAVTVRQSRDGEIYLHVVRRGGDEGLTDRAARLCFTLPDGYTVSDVVGETPFAESRQVAVEYTLDKNILAIQTAEFDTYLLLYLKR